MGNHSKQNRRISEIIDSLAKLDTLDIDLNSSAVRELQSLVEARVTHNARLFLFKNEWDGYRVFLSCSERVRLDAAGHERRLSQKRNFEALRAAIAEPPLLAVAKIVAPCMVDSAHGMMRRRDRFSRPHRERLLTGCER